ncbi:MarR family winged helix-turn-helix transcriptional regulator [Parvularcula sp. IMCC14364]|uniref:MarR family winged helix-turn-helix transcriptional regulator n=1 Tax=Parvularcula sp. IMCC14364 TaxID=3067902 RepID=UPI00274139E4|nr:MarR family transcriptional regulator [Parvularcula sp. IMCC14364]
MLQAIDEYMKKNGAPPSIPADRRTRGLALLLEQTARLIYDEKHPQALHAVQWSALRFFDRAGEQTRTVAGLAKYLGVTSGPASRTTSSLLKRELVSVKPSPSDSRSRVYELTSAGKDILSEDPIQRVASLLTEMPDEDLGVLAKALDKIYAGLDT